MKTLLRLLKFTRGKGWLLALGFVCAVGLLATSLTIPWVVGEGIDRVRVLERGAGQGDALLWFACSILGLAFLSYLFDFLRRYATNYTGQLIEYRIREKLFRHELSLSQSFYDNTPVGELISRATNDLYIIRLFAGRNLNQLLISLLTLLVVCIVLLYKNPLLAVLVLSPVLMLALAAFRFAGATYPIFRSMQAKLAEVTIAVQENVLGIHVVKSFAREPFEKKSFGTKAENVMEEALNARTLQAFYIPGMGFLPAASIALLILFGGRSVIAGDLSLGDFVAFQLYLVQLILPMQVLGMIVDQSQRALAAAERVFEVIDSESDVKSPSQPRPLANSNVPIGVEFRCVSFDYEGDTVLKDVSFNVEPAETVAILGTTGSGKSTLLSLIPRLYDPTRGVVRVGDIDVRELDLEELRRSVGIVPQETLLFSGTVKDNIVFGNPSATHEEVVKAAKVASIHDQILELPEGYDTLLGEQGIALSGGQEQRITIARALVKEPRILILDDATSSVDPETEKHIQAALKDTLDNSSATTTFIVAHRLSTILLADRIAVLKDGRIAESGTHEELLTRGGSYAEMYGTEASELA